MYIVSAKLKISLWPLTPSNKIKVAPCQKRLGTSALKYLETYQKVENTRTKHFECYADVSMVVKTREHLHTKATK